MQSLPLDPNEKAVSDLFVYHFSTLHLPSGSDVIKREIFLFLLGLGGLNYVPVAYQNGRTDEIKRIDAVATGIFGWMVLYISGIIYYQVKIRPQHVDNNLKDIIQPPLTQRAFMKEVGMQIFWAAASAVPLATTLFSADVLVFKTYPIIFWITFSYILMVNTVMHLIPVELTMNDPVYGFFPQLFIHCFHSLFGYRLSPAEEEQKARLEVRNQVVCRIRGNIFRGKDAFLNDLRFLPKDKLEEKIDYYRNDPKLLLSAIQGYTSCVPALGVNQEKLLRFFGGVCMFIACLGYAASPYLVFKQYFHLPTLIAIAAVAIPIYFFMLLMVYFGDNIGVRFFKDVLAFKRIISRESTWDHKLPLVARSSLAPFSFSMLVMCFLVLFSGAASREMNEIAFGDLLPKCWMYALIGMTDTVLALLASYVFLDVVKIMLTYYAQYIDQDPIVLFKTQIEALMKDLDRLQPQHVDALQEYVSSLDEPSKEYSLSVSRDASCCFCWQRRSQDSYAEPLLGGP